MAAVVVAVVLAVGYVAMAVIGDAEAIPDAAPTAETFPPGTITPPDSSELGCGEYTWGLDAQLREDPTDRFAAEHDCLQEALVAGHPAVLVEHSFTTEGDPIRQQLRVVAPARLELTYDATLDNFGSGTVDTVSCTGFTIEHSRAAPTGCDPSAARGDLD